MNAKKVLTITIMAGILLVGCNKQTAVKQSTKSIKADNSKIATASLKDTKEDKYDGMLKDMYEPQAYQKYFTETNKEYRIDDITKWKNDSGKWCYPEGFELFCCPGDDSVMASQQFPEELLEDMNTYELYDYILNAPGDLSIVLYDDYMYALSTYRSLYNFIDNLMGRKDVAEVVHKQYQTYTQKEINLLTKDNAVANGLSSDRKKQENFQLTEGLERFYTGKISAEDYRTSQ